MTKEFLSICIPTYNRHYLLRDLLTSLAKEITLNQFTIEDVKIYVSDNASTDATKAVVFEILGNYPHLIYCPNATNIGGDRNILACYEKSQGHYRWIIGDDEIIPMGALQHILVCLRREKPAWFINNGGVIRYNEIFRLPRVFPNIQDFIFVAAKELPEALMLPGFISGNIFREDCFDIELGLQIVNESIYSQFFALLQGLKRQGGSVFFTEKQTIIIRPERPAPSGGILPMDSDGNWRKCMVWVKEEFGVAELDINQNSKLVSQSIFKELVRHPVKTFLKYRSFFFIPNAYPRMLRRLYWLLRS